MLIVVLLLRIAPVNLNIIFTGGTMEIESAKLIAEAIKSGLQDIAFSVMVIGLLFLIFKDMGGD